MKKLNLNGTLKKEQKFFCPHCKNGKMYSQDTIYKTDLMGDNYRDIVCPVCLTKYKPKLLVPLLQVDIFPGERVSKEKLNKFRKKKDNLVTLKNAGYVQLIIAEDFRKKVKEMKNEIEKQLEEFQETGLCTEHKFVKSQPFKTSEGSFEIESCLVCKKSKVNYNGKTYVDDLWKIVNFVIQQGIENDKKLQLEIKPIVKGLFDIETIKDIEDSQEALNLFDIETDKLFDVETKEDLFATQNLF